MSTAQNASTRFLPFGPALRPSLTFTGKERKCRATSVEMNNGSVGSNVSYRGYISCERRPSASPRRLRVVQQVSPGGACALCQRFCLFLGFLSLPFPFLLPFLPRFLLIFSTHRKRGCVCSFNRAVG